MDIYEFAKMLNGREYFNEITGEEEKLAKGLGFVVVFGQSDDLCELRGAIDDEIGCYDEKTIYLSEDGLFDQCEHGNECNDCKLFRAALSQFKNIKAVWCCQDYFSWTYETDIPHATFDIFDGEEPYCRGIVFDLNNLEGEK